MSNLNNNNKNPSKDEKVTENVAQCKFFSAGNCRRGNKCKFKHDKAKTNKTSKTKDRFPKLRVYYPDYLQKLADDIGGCYKSSFSSVKNPHGPAALIRSASRARAVRYALESNCDHIIIAYPSDYELSLAPLDERISYFREKVYSSDLVRGREVFDQEPKEGKIIVVINDVYHRSVIHDLYPNATYVAALTHYPGMAGRFKKKIGGEVFDLGYYYKLDGMIHAYSSSTEACAYVDPNATSVLFQGPVVEFGDSRYSVNYEWNYYNRHVVTYTRTLDKVLFAIPPSTGELIPDDYIWRELARKIQPSLVSGRNHASTYASNQALMLRLNPATKSGLPFFSTELGDEMMRRAMFLTIQHSVSLAIPILDIDPSYLEQVRRNKARELRTYYSEDTSDSIVVLQEKQSLFSFVPRAWNVIAGLSNDTYSYIRNKVGSKNLLESLAGTIGVTKRKVFNSLLKDRRKMEHGAYWFKAQFRAKKILFLSGIITFNMVNAIVERAIRDFGLLPTTAIWLVESLIYLKQENLFNIVNRMTSGEIPLQFVAHLMFYMTNPFLGVVMQYYWDCMMDRELMEEAFALCWEETVDFDSVESSNGRMALIEMMEGHNISKIENEVPEDYFKISEDFVKTFPPSDISINNVRVDTDSAVDIAIHEIEEADKVFPIIQTNTIMPKTQTTKANTLIGFHSRIGDPQVKPMPGWWSQTCQPWTRILKQMPVIIPWSHERILAHFDKFPGGKRRSYVEARERVMNELLCVDKETVPGVSRTKALECIKYKTVNGVEYQRQRIFIAMLPLGVVAGIDWIKPLQEQMAKVVNNLEITNNVFLTLAYKDTTTTLTRWMRNASKVPGLHIHNSTDDTLFVLTRNNKVLCAGSDLKSCDLSCGNDAQDFVYKNMLPILVPEMKQEVLDIYYAQTHGKTRLKSGNMKISYETERRTPSGSLLTGLSGQIIAITPIMKALNKIDIMTCTTKYIVSSLNKQHHQAGLKLIWQPQPFKNGVTTYLSCATYLLDGVYTIAPISITKFVASKSDAKKVFPRYNETLAWKLMLGCLGGNKSLQALPSGRLLTELYHRQGSKPTAKQYDMFLHHTNNYDNPLYSESETEYKIDIPTVMNTMILFSEIGRIEEDSLFHYIMFLDDLEQSKLGSVVDNLFMRNIARLHYDHEVEFNVIKSKC
eukprot:NODE_13_length_3782_cov_398.684436_g9_i0.p1 GENE.NODE_13_length_3782_cov_398.684436_g9_i0~~NODE_13_length_3782_cov_398.684436_g9_i0.p1  ORF type:complete len:1168 (+),score=-97.83 NODE_13_length_3782_cov_398.684436_g9_i0:131-3634(+)